MCNVINQVIIIYSECLVVRHGNNHKLTKKFLTYIDTNFKNASYKEFNRWLANNPDAITS